MTIQLVKGHYNGKEAIELITHMVHVKIKFHETKLTNSILEEDIKHCEHRIKQLQKELYNARNYIKQQGGTFAIEGEIVLISK